MSKYYFFHQKIVLILFSQTDLLTKRNWKYSDLLTAINQLSAGLQSVHGLCKGQFVGLALPNSAEFVVSLLAVMRCGGVASFINPAYNISKQNCYDAPCPGLLSIF